nr:hypothetical protein [Escherichia coli]
MRRSGQQMQLSPVVSKRRVHHHAIKFLNLIRRRPGQKIGFRGLVTFSPGDQTIQCIQFDAGYVDTFSGNIEANPRAQYWAPAAVPPPRPQ